MFELGFGRALLSLLVGIALVAGACTDDTSDADNEAVAFCRLYRSAVGNFSAIGELDLNDAESVADAIAEFDALVDEAPGEISDDVTEVARVWSIILGDLEGTAPAARDEVLVEHQTDIEAVADNADNMNTYAAANCTSVRLPEAEPTPTPTPLAIEG